jgi:hypothetical protein
MKLLEIYKGLLNELRVINPHFFSMENEEPLKDSDVIRVYHGFNDYEDAIMAVKFGFSGKERARRIYSYESNNNPNGLFVTLDFNRAKEFTHPRGKTGISVIMELSVRVSDLEAPVWPSGSYTVQGQMAQYWKDAEDRYEQGTLKARELAKDSKYGFISGSDRPELANTLMMGENQALFMGDINPNMIKTIWFGEAGKPNYNPKNYERISIKDFLNKFDSHEPEKGYDGRETTKGELYGRKKNKLFKPNDDYSMDIFSQILKDKGYADGSEEETIDVLKNLDNLDWFFWPKQIKQIEKLLDETND